MSRVGRVGSEQACESAELIADFCPANLKFKLSPQPLVFECAADFRSWGMAVIMRGAQHDGLIYPEGFLHAADGA
jgi:hypothetical protein